MEYERARKAEDVRSIVNARVTPPIARELGIEDSSPAMATKRRA
jgi:hypothetical protein